MRAHPTQPIESAEDCLARGDGAGAERACRARIARAPGDGRDLRLLGEALRAQGRIVEAVQAFIEAVATEPTECENHVGLARALVAIDQVDGAVALLEQASRLLPRSGAVRTALAQALASRGDRAASLARYAEATVVDPGRAEGWADYASALLRESRGEEALSAMARAEALAPGHPELLYNRAAILSHLGRPLDAEAALREVLRAAPGHARAWSNLGQALADATARGLATDDDVRARAIEHALGRALECDPRLDDARWNLALHHLRHGRLREGFGAYEARRAIGLVPPPPAGVPAWRGEPLSGRSGGTLLLVAEQGLGDTVQFVRYAAPARARVGRIVLAAQRPLVALLRGVAGVDAIVALDDPRPAADAWAPLLSLPHLLDAMPDEVHPGRPEARATSYLAADRALVASWRARLAMDARHLRVGLAWQGNPTYAADARRSLPLSRLRPVLDTPGARFVALQRGPGLEQIAALPEGARPKDPGPDLDARGAFVDTAAVLAGLDLLVCSDSAIAHVAGALGVTTWLLLPHVADWRWGKDDERTPWYPSMRLFRQRRAGDWDEVALRVAEALAEGISSLETP